MAGDAVLLPGQLVDLALGRGAAAFGIGLDLGQQLVGGQVPSTDAVQAAQPKPAIAGDSGLADGARGNGSGVAPPAL